MKKTTAVVVLALLVFVFTTLVMANGPRISAADNSGWTAGATTTTTALAATVNGGSLTVAAGGLVTNTSVTSNNSQFYGGSTTAETDIVGFITAAAASTTVPAVKVYPLNALGTNDLVFQVATVSGAANLMSVDYEGDVVATGTVSSNIASGSNAFAVATNGGRIDFGAGASDYMSSDGTTITTPTDFQAQNLVATNGRVFARNALSGFSFGSAGTQYFGMNAGASTMTLGNSAIFDIASGATIKMNGLLMWSSVAPTITSACTTPTVTHGAVPSFQVDVGGTCAGINTIVLALPTTTNGWECHGYSKTAGTMIIQTGDTTAAATIKNYTIVGGVLTDFVDGQDLVISCIGR